MTKELIENLGQQLAFEKQRLKNLTSDNAKGWTAEYLEGYIAGLEQAISCANEYDNEKLIKIMLKNGFLCPACNHKFTEKELRHYISNA